MVPSQSPITPAAPNSIHIRGDEPQCAVRAPRKERSPIHRLGGAASTTAIASSRGAYFASFSVKREGLVNLPDREAVVLQVVQNVLELIALDHRFPLRQPEVIEEILQGVDPRPIEELGALVGSSSTEVMMMVAASSTEPSALTHEVSSWGERNKARSG